VKINGKLCYLWWAVDHEGEALETVVTAKRDKAAAVRFLKRIMKKYGRPRSVVTDELCSYPARIGDLTYTLSCSCACLTPKPGGATSLS
jgi:putative transposase